MRVGVRKDINTHAHTHTQVRAHTQKLKEIRVVKTLIHGARLGRQKQNIDPARSSNEKSMGVRSSSALWQRRGSSGQALVTQPTPSWGLSLVQKNIKRVISYLLE